MNDDSDEPLSSEESDVDQDYDSDSDEEQDYEQAPRQAEGWSEKGSTRLPIKLADGRIKEVKDDRIRPSEVKDAEPEEVVDSDFAEDEEEEEAEEEEEVVEEKKLPKKVLLAKKKEELATIAQTIIANPEENVSDSRVFLRTISSFLMKVVRILNTVFLLLYRLDN